MSHRLAAVLAVLLVFACRRDGPKAPPAPTPLVLGPENVAVVRSGQISTGPPISGTITPERQATIRAQVSGPVLETLVEAGQRVRAGQVLGRLDQTAISDQVRSARSAVATAENALRSAQRDVERNQTLLKVGGVAPRALEQAQDAQAAAQSQLANARAQLASAEQQLARTTLRAPFAGTVSERLVNAGDVVSPGTALFTVVDPRTMRLEASVPADAIGSVTLNAPVDFTVTGYPDRHFQGRITRINPVADPTTRQVRIFISLPNETGTLVGGLFAEGRVASETHTNPLVPAGAVRETTGQPTVLAVDSGVVNPVQVQLGIRSAGGDTVEVTHGVSPGDTVLVGVATTVAAGTPVAIAAPEERQGTASRR